MPFDDSPTHPCSGRFLARRDTLVLDGARGTTIAVDGGTLWVTLERDPRDIILTRGMRFDIGRGGRTVIGAERDSCLRLIPAPGLRKRFAAWLTGATSSISGVVLGAAAVVMSAATLALLVALPAV
jgi:hypothetical protein